MIGEQLKERSGFSAIECSIADYFLEAGSTLREQSARSIAAKLYTAPSTVSRLCKHLGFSGYNEFREAFLDELRYLSSAFADIDANQPFRKGDNPYTIAAKVGALYRETVDDTLSLVQTEALERATELVAQARTTIVYAAGTQIYLAYDFADKMARIGRQVLVSTKEDLTFHLGSMPHADDLFVVISYSGETPSMLRVAQRIHQQGAPLIAITSYGNNALSQLADVVLHVSTREKLVEKLGSYMMNVSTLLLLDTLYSCVFARDYERNAIVRVRAGHGFEVYRDSSNPTLHDRRDGRTPGGPIEHRGSAG